VLIDLLHKYLTLPKGSLLVVYTAISLHGLEVQVFSWMFRPYALQLTASVFHSKSRKFRSFAWRFRTSDVTVTAAGLRVFMFLGRPTIFIFLPCVSDLIESTPLTLALTLTYSTPNPCIALKWVVSLIELEH
jgi:hypothetical protein